MRRSVILALVLVSTGCSDDGAPKIRAVTPRAQPTEPVVVVERAVRVEEPEAPQVRFVVERGHEGQPWEGVVAYPVFSSNRDGYFDVVNAQVLRYARAFMTDWARAFEDGGAEEGALFTMACSVEHASTRFVSIGCDSYVFNGGAHGIKGFAGLNYSMPGGVPVPLQRLISMSTSGTRLVRLCDDALRRRASNDFGREEGDTLQGHLGWGATPEEQFREYTVGYDGIRFYFKDILPHVVADTVVPLVTWRALAEHHILRPDAPVSDVPSSGTTRPRLRQPLPGACEAATAARPVDLLGSAVWPQRGSRSARAASRAS